MEDAHYRIDANKLKEKPCMSMHLLLIIYLFSMFIAMIHVFDKILKYFFAVESQNCSKTTN